MMNVIFVGKSIRGTKTLELGRRSVQVKLALLMLTVVGAIVALSFSAGRWLGDKQGLSRSQISELRSTLMAQAEKIEQTEADAQRNLDALALELGQLQAHAARLDALGVRLTKIGKLDDGEFDFASTPALGGPESESSHLSFMSSQFGEAISELRSRFDSQDQQLALLENLLLDRDLDQSLVPKGMPVRSGYVASGFGMRVDPVHGRFTMHAGVDFPGPYGSEVLAVADGVVTWSGVKNGYGNTIDIDHGNGFKTRYGHNSKNIAKVGDRVRANEVIAKMGSTGRSTGSHVHFEVPRDGKPVNPAEFVAAIR
jgi:murein DD-endopeptidase MepM/ murein hydrolase activator NlpD